MKLQLQDNSLRLRVDEDELAVLLSGEAIAVRTAFGDAFALAGSVTVCDTTQASIEGSSHAYRMRIPGADVRALALRLPSRDGLIFPLAGGGELRFDVDVRDSVRRRHP